MKRLSQFVILAAVSMALVLAAFAKNNLKTIELPDDHPVAKLKPGPGVDTVEANCMGCHSTDYIVRQPGGNAQRWQDEVSKMIKLFGATVSDQDAKVIVNYLATAHARAPAKTPPATKPTPSTRSPKEISPPR